MLGIEKDVRNIIKGIKETDEWDLVLVLLMGVLILIPIVKILLIIGALWYAYYLEGVTGAVCVLCGVIIGTLIGSRKN